MCYNICNAHHFVIYLGNIKKSKIKSHEHDFLTPVRKWCWNLFKKRKWESQCHPSRPVPHPDANGYCRKRKTQFIRSVWPDSSFFQRDKSQRSAAGSQTSSARSTGHLLQRTSERSYAITMQLCIRRLACQAFLVGVLLVAAAAGKFPVRLLRNIVLIFIL